MLIKVSFHLETFVMKHQLILPLLVLLAKHCQSTPNVKPCDIKQFDGKSSFVCVCNATYCDEYDLIENYIEIGSALVVTSDISSKRFEWKHVAYSPEDDPERYEVVLDENETFQEILGFGGAFTDSAGHNINLMADQILIDKIIESYYSPKFLDYSIGRVNMGGCDFSTRQYTYVDTEGDVELNTFELQHEDLVDKIPLIKKAKNLRPTPLKLFASPWSAPAWMKSNNHLNGQGYLLPEYYQAWANYFVKFLNAYKDNDITFWGLTAQNEPWDGIVPNFTFNAMGWNSSTQHEWIVNNLGPALEDNGYSDIQLMILDDQRPLAPKWARDVLADDKAMKYVSGIGIHWYMDDVIPVPFALDQTHEEFPDKFLFYTEACNGDKPWDTEKVMLGDWHRGEKYIHNIIEDLNHWVTGWTDWNLVLDLQGGPNWAGNFVDAPIIVEPEAGVFYKQPMYYALGHISRFLIPRSIRIGMTKDYDSIEAVAFKRPDDLIAVIILNRSIETIKISLKSTKGNLNLDIEPRSFNSLIL